MRYDASLLGRFCAKFAFDVLPAALASAIGGFLLTHYGLGRATEPALQAAPASAEMMQLLRDEHGLIVSFLKAERASEKQRLAAEDGTPRVTPAAAGDVETTGLTARPRQVVITTTALKSGARSRTPVVGASLPPLVIAQVQPEAAVKASDQGSFYARTIGIKEHVVAATHRVVSVIGGIPSWIGAIGDHIGGEGIPRPPANLVSAS